MTATLPQARLGDGAIGEFLPDLLRLATALTGSPPIALDLVADALTRRPALIRRALAADFPEPRLRAILVQQFLSRRDHDLPDSPGSLNGLTRCSRAAVVLRDGYQLTALEIGTVLDRPAKTVIADLDAHPHDYSTQIAALASEAPPGDDLDARLSRSTWRHRRTRARAIAIGAAVIVVVAALVAIPTVILPRLPAPVRTAGEWRYSHVVRPATGWTVVMHSITPTVEMSEIKPPVQGDDPYSCWVRVYTAGVFKPGEQPVTQQTNVHGRPAFYGLTQDQDGFLAWEYGDNAWAQAYCSLTERNSPVLQTLAAMVSFEPAEVRLPFSLASIPSGYRFSGLTEYPDSHLVEMQLAKSDIKPGDVNLVVSAPFDRFGNDGGDPEVINGRTWNYVSGGEPRMCSTDAVRRSLCVSGYWPGGDWPAPAPDPRNAPSQIRALVKVLTPAADLGKPDSWATGAQLPS